ncbi:MAG: hypothetical protein PHX75_01325 [Candidatus Methanomethylophilaceae archaeon]|nr:hypothetical protein [Candidatus Methanomethylophilaceae archaeon]
MTRSEIPRYAKALPPLLLAAAAISVYLAYGSWPGDHAYLWVAAAISAGIASLALSVSLRRYGAARRRSAEEAFLKMASGPVTGSGGSSKGKVPR